MAKLLIFDWDGTLCDSLARIARCLQLAAADLGVRPPSEQSAKQFVGLGLAEVMRRLFPNSDEPQIARLCESYSQHFVQHDGQPSDLFPGVEQALQLFKNQGQLLAIATGKSRRGLNRVLDGRGWEDFFHGSRCADETASKPDPLMLYELLDEFRVKPGEALMIGDTEFDMEMAMSADIPRLAVSYGAHPAERLEQYKPVFCASSFFEVQDYILK